MSEWPCSNRSAKFYAAGRVDHRSMVKRMANEIENIRLLHKCNSRWFEIDDNVTNDTEIAETCLEDIRNCDYVVILPDSKGRGLFVEMGYALALGKPIVLWNGPSGSCVFEELCMDVAP